MPSTSAVDSTTAPSPSDPSFDARIAEQWYQPRIPRAVLKELMKRDDAAGLRNFIPWFALLVASGAVAAFTWGTWWAVPAFFVYGTIYSSSDARWHELSHGTPFKTRRINDAFYHLSSFMTIREGYWWRWSHARHHTHTYFQTRDPEIQVTRPTKVLPIVADFAGLVGCTLEIGKVVRHAFGRVDAATDAFLPASEKPKMIWSCRIYLAVVIGTIALALALHSFLPLMFVWTPRLYGGWLHQLLGLTQHAGLAVNVKDHRLNTRTVHTNFVFRFLYLNMNYHLEHHLLPMVPFHALPRLHDAIKDQLPPAYPSVYAAYREMLPALWKQRSDPKHVIERTLPAA
ncbi:fatty acid desaturase [Paraburkholderia caribensis]|uniref:fatty acid desaturase n=1 Tax=Paraburkholderia caribensis TaxID=75105 RepID=UPI0028579FBB|nr:fatty acid desaturase [Paraburkholderia caribensis]MDR6381923.1 fatty acid desaturase [Paraburkholderia caribensis]